VCTYAYINNKFVQDPDPESDPDPDTDPESDPKLFEKSDPDPDTDPKKIIPDPQHCFLYVINKYRTVLTSKYLKLKYRTLPSEAPSQL
jgi:hypothetical protein